MFTFTLPLFSSLLLLHFFTTTTTAAQPYQATDYFLLDCGSPSNTTSHDWRQDGDERSKFVPSNINTTSFSSTPSSQDASPPQFPYATARIFNTSSFTYEFPVSKRPQFLRLYFYPATYSDLNANQSFFSVSSNGYSLLTNFSAFLTASFLGRTLSEAGPPVPFFVKEFIIYVKDTQTLNVTFTPSPNSYAFINAIEIVSLPENLYFNAVNLKYVAQTSGPVIADDMALENIYRLDVGGGKISGKNDTGMYRSWDQDDNYLFPPTAKGVIPVAKIPITYTVDTPTYTAPELVYATQRSMGSLAKEYNLTWILPVDSGFYYMLRLHFCNIIPQYTKTGEVVFRIFINNQTAEEEADVFFWTKGSGYPVYKDYVVFVTNPNGRRSKQDLWLAMHPNLGASGGYADAYLNGLEVFKLSMGDNLASPKPTTPPTSPVKGITKKKYATIIGGVGGGLVLLSVLVLIVLQQRRRVKHYGTGDKSSWSLSSSESDSTKSCHSSLPSDLCRNFSLTEVNVAVKSLFCLVLGCAFVAFS